MKLLLRRLKTKMRHLLGVLNMWWSINRLNVYQFMLSSTQGNRKIEKFRSVQNVSIYPSSRATFIWDLWFFSEMLEVVLRENDLIWFLFWFSRLETRCQVSEKLNNYKGRGQLDETSLVGLCLFYLMSCISVFSRFTFLHRYNYVFVFKILPGYGRIRVRPHEVWSGEAGFYCVFELISSNPDSVVSSSSRFFV